MFSMTTIASSTTSPVASVSPKSVSVLIENVSDGMSVVRQSCRNRKMTSTTSAIATSNVVTTSLIDSLTNNVVSKATS